MAVPSKDVLRRNTIVPSVAPDKLACSICVADQSSKDWNSHIAKPSHVATLENFLRTFENRDDGAVCKICRSEVAWDGVKIHAKSHMIVPWYEPEDRYRIFYENHTLKFSVNYYCYLCDEIFHDWLTIYSHIGRERHQRIVQNMRQSVPMRGSKKFYLDLIVNGFVPTIDGGVECRFCQKSDLGYHVTAEHASGFAHLQSKKKFIDDLSSRIEKEISSKPPVEAPEPDEPVPNASKSEKSAPISSDSRATTEKSVSSSSDCRMICNFLLAPEALISGADRPASSQKPSEEKPHASSSSQDWMEKVPELFHEYNADYIVSSASALCDEARSRNGEKKKRRRAKQITDDPDPYCLICSFAIPGHAAVKDHVTGPGHAISRSKYGCDGIVCIEANWYYCRYCDCTLTGFDKLYRHLIDDSHTRSIVADAERIPGVGGTNSEAMEASRPASNSKNQYCMYVVRRNAKKSFCQICGETEYPIATKSIKEHTESQGHKEALLRYGCENIVAGEKNYHCRCCGVELSGLENVYLHVKDKRHTRSMVKVIANGKSQTRKRIRDNYETQEYYQEVVQPSGSNLLSDYIANQIPSYSNDFPQLGQQRAYTTSYFPMQPSYDNAFAANAAQPANGFWSFPQRPESSPRESYLHQHEIGFNNRQLHAANAPQPANGFWSFPQRAESSSREPYPHQHEIGFNNRLLHGATNFWAFPDKFRTPETFGNARTNAGAYPANSSSERAPTKSFFDCYASPNGQSGEEHSARPQWNSMLTSMAGELSKFLEISEASQAKNAPIARFNVRDNLRVEKIHCNLCEAVVDDMTQLHVHMAKHFSDDFARPKRNRYGNGGINYAINDSDARNFVELSRSMADPSQGSLPRDNGLADAPTLNGARCIENAKSPTSNTIDERGDESARFFPSDKNDNPQKQHQSPKRTSVKKMIKILDFDDDWIYEIKEKTADIELGMRLSLTIDSSRIYCLVCRRIVESPLSNYYEHLCSLDHCEYLDLMERDFGLFVDVEGQFSDLDLAQEYMEETSDVAVRCFVCDVEVANSEETIERHIYESEHSRRCLDEQARAMKNLRALKPRLDCDWYKVQKYWCVVCSTWTESEVNFVKHLKSGKHARIVNNIENCDKRLMHDFCADCAVLWYGYRCTYSYHSDIPSHQWLARDGHFVFTDLSKFTKMLLDRPEEFVEERVKYLDDIYETERRKEEQLVGDLERAVRTKFSRAKAYSFGSRASGLAAPDSDVDIYLDCRNQYNGDETSDLQLYFMNGVNQCLNKDSQSWDVEEVLAGCRCPIIRAYHRATGLKCDISFQNGLSVENTKLIKTYINVFPTCRKLILFLKQWLAHCELQASRALTSYALYWFVIFYLQQESILPSVATLIAMSKKSHTIAGWEVSVSQNFVSNERASNYSVKEFLTRFFKFYANFDFRHWVACPLLGEELPKREFIEPENLPAPMTPYVDYLRSAGKNAQPFRIDSVMCIQDPFDLRHNLTEAVSKVYLNRFRTSCLKSLDYLSASQNST